MDIYSSSRFKRTLKSAVKKNNKLAETIDSRITLLQNNPQNPSLRLHKLTSRENDEWSITITRSIRLIFQYIPEGILLIDIGTHDQVY